MAPETTPKLRRRLRSDRCLREVYEVSTREMKQILKARQKDYEIKGYVWEDEETTNWSENVIEVKTKFKDFSEKEELWDILGQILKSTQRIVARAYHRTVPEDKTLFILHLSEMQ